MPYRDPTPEELGQACLNYRHDFGLMTPEQREKLMFEAKEWLMAWFKVVESKEEKR
jgi:hypothetical protein